MNATSDFKATISITNPSPLAQSLMQLLPSNYTQDQNSNVYALMYGSGYSAEQLKQTNGQSEANNYINSPSTQTGQIAVPGTGTFLVEFDLPFVVPPLNVSIQGSTTTDCFIEYTSRFGMTVTVTQGSSDILQWSATGAVGAATDPVLGDALYNNFGTVLNIPRVNDSVVNASWVNQYINVTTFVTVNAMIPVQNFTVPVVIGQPLTLNAPPGANSLRGQLQPTSVVCTPSASHQLVADDGTILALLSFNGSTFPLISTTTSATSAMTTTDLITGFYPANLQDRYFPNPTNDGTIEAKIMYSTFDVYISGVVSTVTFNPWDQLSYVQENFRADNCYRRILAGVNQALTIGPNADGIATLTEALFSQPYIPQDIWDASDFRVFTNTANALTTQYDGTPTTNPIVQILEVTNSWTPETLTYNNRPIVTEINDVPNVEVTTLNTPTKFDLTNELIRELRVGIDADTGGIINWNYLPESLQSLYTTGNMVNGQTYAYNYLFLNNADDSIASLILFYYQTLFSGSNPTGYQSFGPLVLGRDYYLVNTSDLYDPSANNGAGGYNLPSELMFKYAASSAIPFVTTIPGVGTQGTNYIYDPADNKPQLPSVVIQIDLTASGYNATSKFPISQTDFILYSYAEVTCSPGVATGTFDTDPNNTHLIEFYDSQSAYSVQPSNSPFASSNVRLAQGSFARMTDDVGYKFTTSLIGGQITFNKTVTVENLLNHVPNESYGPCGIPVLKILSAGVATTTSQGLTSIGQFFSIQGRVVTNTFQGQPYFQIENAQYIIIDKYNYPIAIVDPSSIIAIGQAPYFVSNYEVTTHEFVYSGAVGSIIWDTRIPVTDYQDTSPVFQVADNFGAEIDAFTPTIDVVPSALPVNTNFMALIRAVPLGNQQTVTASWTFNVVQQKSQYLSNALNGIPSIGFPDLKAELDVLGNVIEPAQPGIMSYFTGKYTLDTLGLDPDNGQYTQTYVSPQFTAYFIGYKDMLLTDYGPTCPGGSILSTQGDSELFDTISNSYTVPGNYATILVFFNPRIGFFSTSVIPGMEFYNTNSSATIDIVRPRNLGIALRLLRDSYNGLVFYGTSLDQNVDKPTRMVLDFSFAASQGDTRHRVFEIEDDTFAGWVDGMRPDETVSEGSTFFLAGDEFKYSALGLDQAINRFGPGFDANGNYDALLDQGLILGEQYSLTSTPYPAYEVRPGDTTSTPTVPQRYRRPPQWVYNSSGAEVQSSTYYNRTPEKIAYFKFDFSSMPIDTYLQSAILEITFCSGFTIRTGLQKNMTLCYNSLWNKSRLSGNGLTQQVILRDTNNIPLKDSSGNQLPPITRPLNNVHWRKNFFEIVVPYAFQSNFDYDFANIFNPVSINLLSTQVPTSGLEYVGFINLDEIGVSPIPVETNVYVETTQGLSNLTLSSQTVVWHVVQGTLSATASGAPNIGPWSSTVINIDSTLQSTPDGLPTYNQWLAATGAGIVNSAFRYYQVIDQDSILPNMKVVVFPFGILNDAYGNPDPQNSQFVYGYVTSVLPSNIVSFDSNHVAQYTNLFEYIVPTYAEYNVNLLESDTYFPFMTFGRNTTISGTTQDISF